MTTNPSHDLFESGWLFDTGVAGVTGKSEKFEAIVAAIDHILINISDFSQAEMVSFPPVMNADFAERSGYRANFPHLLADVKVWRDYRCEAVDTNDGQTDACDQALVLTPAACYPVYPLMGARSPIDAAGHVLSVQGYCFRAEPSFCLHRQQSFRMREFVFVGPPLEARRFQRLGIAAGEKLARDFGLRFSTTSASDPFFGELSDLQSEMQTRQELKFELLISSPWQENVACGSFNYHIDHFTSEWSITDRRGETPHSACCAFGLDRLVLQLLAEHGLQLEQWPTSLTKLLDIRAAK